MPEFGDQNTTIDHKHLHLFLDTCIEKSDGKQELFTVLFVHLRGMRRINTMLGYDAGEMAIETVLMRMRDVLPDCDKVGRLSSDELIIVSMDCNSPSCAIKGSRAAISALDPVVTIDDVDCKIDPAIGIAVYPNDGENAQSLIRHAALAAEKASANEEPCFEFFSPCLGQAAHQEFDLQQAIRKATSQKQFELHYQPKLDAKTLEFVGCEALIRWRDPDQGLRMPGEFIDTAERGGLMLPIGYFVLQTACNQLRDWIDQGYQNAAISINVTAKQFNTYDWVEIVTRIFKTCAIPANRLTLELTEDCSVLEIDGLIDKMRALRANGIRISIDDFGTGHSSLAYLSKLPVDEIKIDRFFVQSAFTDQTNAQICRNVIELAHGLGAVVTAEGIEEPEQADWLRDLGCDIFQGFLFDKAQPVDDFVFWLEPGACGRSRNNVTRPAKSA